MKVIKCLILSLVFATTCFASIAAQTFPDVTGTIVDFNGKPMRFVNVVLLAAQDSTLIQGTTTDELGKFNIVTSEVNGILKISSVGYETVYVNLSDYREGNTISMVEDAQMLNEVTVKSQLPKTKLTGNSMVTSIQGSVLEKSGTAKEMLAKVPGMTLRSDELEVIGKGTPVFYINGRKVNDKDELKRMRSEDIKEVEVITNPGAQYDAAVSAVVRIKTLRRQGSGFGFDFDVTNSNDLAYGNDDPSANLNLRYRHNKVDLFAGINYSKWDGVSDSYPEQLSFVKGANGQIKTIEQLMHIYSKTNMQVINSNVGFNWQLSDSHSIGMRIERHDNINTKTHVDVDTDLRQCLSIQSLKQEYEHSHSSQKGLKKQPYSWEGNVYYNGKTGKLGIDFNFDFVANESSDGNDIDESANGTRISMSSDTRNKSYMFANKLVLSYPIWKGQLQAGTEMSFVKRSSQYQISNIPLPASNSEVKENNVAGFVEYAFMLPKVGSFSTGVRYEHVGFDYNDLLNTAKSMSRYTDDLFPSVSWANQWGNWQASVSYSYRTERPNFRSFDESIFYINSYSLQQGNAKMKNEKAQQVGFNLRWKYLNLFASYRHITDAITQWSYIYDYQNEGGNQLDTEGVILIKTINLDRPVRISTVYLSASPTFGCYSPYWTVGVQQHYIKNTLADPREPSGQRELKYYRPLFVMNLNNAFRFKHSWQIEANLNAFTRGDFMNMRLHSDTWNLGFVIQKCWLKHDALCLRASIQDALRKTSPKIEMDCGYYLLNQRSYNNLQRLEVSLRYTFNAQQSKYKGTGAGKGVAGRMGN